jgi:hypothetical protein
MNAGSLHAVDLEDLGEQQFRKYLTRSRTSRSRRR